MNSAAIQSHYHSKEPQTSEKKQGSILLTINLNNLLKLSFYLRQKKLIYLPCNKSCVASRQYPFIRHSASDCKSLFKLPAICIHHLELGMSFDAPASRGYLLKNFFSFPLQRLGDCDIAYSLICGCKRVQFYF